MKVDELNIEAFLATLKSLQLVLDEYSAERAKAQPLLAAESLTMVPTAMLSE